MSADENELSAETVGSGLSYLYMSGNLGYASGSGILQLKDKIR